MRNPTASCDSPDVKVVEVEDAAAAGTAVAEVRARALPERARQNNHSPPSKSAGGGPRITLSDSPFKGREAGGGTRGTVYGTSRYGSGYPYGYGDSYYVSSYPFPYYYWPTPVQYRYYGCSTYGYNENERPGGVTVTIPIKSTISSTNDTYHLLGDTSSAQAVMDSLTRECNVAPASLDWTFSNFNESMRVKPEEVVQWYRASTFALALDGYNNTPALISNMKDEHTAPPPLSADTPLPGWVNRTFLDCVNKTIGEALPLVDPSKHKLNGGQIAGIVIGSVFGAIFISIAIYLLVAHCWDKRKHKITRWWRNYAPINKPRKTDHDVEPVETKKSVSYDDKHASSDEKLLVPKSKSDAPSSSTSPTTSSEYSDDDAPAPPKLPFPQPKSTLEMEAKPTTYPAFPGPFDVKRS
jgi:hypothetical protein